MSEGLSSRDEYISKTLREKHADAANMLIDSKDENDSTEKIVDYSDPKSSASGGAIVAFANKSVKEIEAQDKYDANLWRAHQHKEEHLDQYIETARQEAESQGVHINLEQPKE